MKEVLRDKKRLEHILDAINRLQTYAGDSLRYIPFDFFTE